MDKDSAPSELSQELVAFGYEQLLKDFQKKVAQVASCVL